jgi:hypothetical protein
VQLRRTGSWLGCAVLTAALAAQESSLVPFVPIDAAPLCAVAMVWRHGLDDDTTTRPGLCRLLLQVRLRRARAAAPDVLASGGDVDATTSLCWAVCDRSATAAALRFLQALADDTRQPTDDEFALARARAALLADDEAFVLPGPMLQAALRRQGLPVPAPACGLSSEPDAILAASQAEVWAALQQERPRRTAALGAFAANFASVAAACDRGPAEPWGAAAGPGPGPDRAEPAFVEHARLDGPVVARACPLGPAARAPVAIAVQIARARAERRWRPRAAEGAARLPFVGWDWLHDDPYVVLHRRGFDQRRLLPGERAADVGAEVAATKGEIESLLADLQQGPVRDDEVAVARTALARTLGHEGGAVAAGDSRGAAVWLAARLRAVVRGIEPSRLAAVTRTDAQAALLAIAAPPTSSWHVLVPRARPGFGFDRR